MTTAHTIAAIRLKAALYVPAADRRDNCGGCCYSDMHLGGGYWCRMHSAPTTKTAICALQEQRRPEACR